MKFTNIVVCGITRIVIDRKDVWIYGDGVWIKSAPESTSVKTHPEMMAIVNHLKVDRRYRMWIHGNVLNVVKAVSIGGRAS